MVSPEDDNIVHIEFPQHSGADPVDDIARIEEESQLLDRLIRENLERLGNQTTLKRIERIEKR